MPSIDAQVASIRRLGGFFTDFPRRFLAVRGTDRIKFLHNIVSNDIKQLQIGQGKPACILDRQGKIQASFLAHAFPEEIVLEMAECDYEPAWQNLKKYLISEAVELADVSSLFRVIPLHGPKSPQVLSSVRPDMALPEQNLHHAAGPADSGILQIVRWDLFRTAGYHLWISPEAEGALLKTLEQQGTAAGFSACGQEIFQTLRIESGVPWPGIDITPAVILNELGTEEMVSFTKGCYIGQEIVARIKYRAHPPRLFKGFRIEGSQMPKTPCSLLQAGKPAGILTSACWSPTMKSVIGLGFLTYGMDEANLSLDGNIKTEIAPLPIVSG